MTYKSFDEKSIGSDMKKWNETKSTTSKWTS